MERWSDGAILGRQNGTQKDQPMTKRHRLFYFAAKKSVKTGLVYELKHGKRAQHFKQHIFKLKIKAI